MEIPFHSFIQMKVSRTCDFKPPIEVNFLIRIFFNHYLFFLIENKVLLCPLREFNAKELKGLPLFIKSYFSFDEYIFDYFEELIPVIFHSLSQVFIVMGYYDSNKHVQQSDLDDNQKGDKE